MSVSAMVLSSLAQPLGILQFVIIAAVITGILAEVALKSLMTWVAKQDWWPSALPLQKALMKNFGCPEESMTEFQCRSSYSYVLVLCSHHVLCGAMMLPVVVYGWAAAGASGQALFVLGALMDVSMDVYDEFRMICVTFFHDAVGKSLFGGEKGPISAFIVIGCLHHPLAMIMVCPLVMHYPGLASFHVIACSLLLAAGICFVTGAYKFSLDVTKSSAWYQFKAIVLLQLVTILYTRGYIWYYHLYLALSTFWSDGSMGFFYGGCVAGTLMSLFNVVLIMDAVGAAVKWLPKKMVKKDSDDHHEVLNDISQMVPPTPAKGAIKGSLLASAALGLAPASTFRADVKVLVAAAKFKKGLAKPLLKTK